MGLYQLFEILWRLWFLHPCWILNLLKIQNRKNFSSYYIVKNNLCNSCLPIIKIKAFFDIIIIFIVLIIISTISLLIFITSNDIMNTFFNPLSNLHSLQNYFDPSHETMPRVFIPLHRTHQSLPFVIRVQMKMTCSLHSQHCYHMTGLERETRNS